MLGGPSAFKSGVGHSAQVIECKKVYSNFLYNSGRLGNGESLHSPNGQHKATVSSDGNFSVDQWQTSTAGKGISPWTLCMQEDANLVLYDADRNPMWSSGSNTRVGRFSQSPYRLEMQDDGNLVVYDSKHRPYWSIFGGLA